MNSAVPDPRFHDVADALTLAEISDASGVALPSDVDPSLMFTGLGGLSEAGPQTISFLANPKYAVHLPETKAGAVLVQPQDATRVPDGTIAWVTPKPYLDFSKISRVFHPEPSLVPDVAATAHIHASAQLGQGVRIEQGAVIGSNVRIGDGVWVGYNTVIDRGCTIGSGTRIAPNCYIGFTDIGSECRIGPGAMIGTRGFGVATDGAGHIELPQVGAVKIGDNVEIGANTCIDRGMGPDTIIGDGTKIDNLVQIAHNVRIGRHCILAGQGGIAGSTVLEDFVICGAQVGIAGHLTVGAGAQIGGKSGVSKSVAPGEKVTGYPARPAQQWLRQHVFISSLMKKSKGGERG